MFFQQDGDHQSIQVLESLMNEFFSDATSNKRKHEIEGLLHNFSSQQGAWKHCVYFLSNTSNQYVCMYSLTTIEHVITKQWLGLMWEERAQLKSTLYQFALENHHNVPAFIRNKVIKLIVDIARLDWPHFYPDFFTNILQLIQNPETVILGLVFLLTASEELIYPWEDLSISRKEELKRLLLAHIPQVFSILCDFLEDVAYKLECHVTATPPPSPTHGEPNSSSPVYSGTLLGYMLQGKEKNMSVNLGTDSEAACCLALKTLAHLFSWVPLSSFMTSQLINVLFLLAQLSQTPSKDENLSIGALAIAAINEIMYKNCIPSSYEDFLLNIFQKTMHLLQYVLSCADSSLIEESYQEKLTEFLRAFVGSHFRRFENNTRFSWQNFLSLLCKYTFHTNTLELYYRCLEVWSVLLDHLTTCNESVYRYHHTLISMLRSTLKKTQFRFNQSELEELDDKTFDDDNQTEWQIFLQRNIEMMAKIADIIPVEVFNILEESWREPFNVYMRLESAVEVRDDSSRHLAVSGELECLRLHCLLRDLSSHIQEFGRLYPHFIGQSFTDRFSEAQTLVGQLISMSKYATRLQLHCFTVTVEVLKSDLIEVQAQVLAALKSWCHWIVQLYNQIGARSLYERFVQDMLESVVPILMRTGEPAKLTHSAAHLFVTITSTVRPPHLWKWEMVQNMFQIASSISYLQNETERLVHRALCNILLLPSPGLSDQQWEERHKLLLNLINMLTCEFQQLHHAGNVVHPQKAQPVITKALGLLGDLVKNMQAEGSATKKCLYSVIQDKLYQALAMFPTYAHSPVISEVILDFFVTAFAGMQQQLGASFTEHIVQTFLNIFTRAHLVSSLDKEGAAGPRAVEKFLQLLELVMAEPTGPFKRFVPSTITLCLEHIYPLISDNPSPDIKPALFAVLHAILMHKWQYFFGSSVLQTLNQAGDYENIDHREEFLTILKAYGQSLLQPDINLFRQNLRSLEEINSKWKLYHKVVFRNELLPQFITVLLHALIHKSHALLDEDIITAIYHMAAVSFDAFLREFLPKFLVSTDGLDDSQRSTLQNNFKHETDLPSFTQNIQRLVNDLRCYKLCNSSLPAGSVKL